MKNQRYKLCDIEKSFFDHVSEVVVGDTDDAKCYDRDIFIKIGAHLEQNDSRESEMFTCDSEPDSTDSEISDSNSSQESMKTSCPTSSSSNSSTGSYVGSGKRVGFHRRISVEQDSSESETIQDNDSVSSSSLTLQDSKTNSTDESTTSSKCRGRVPDNHPNKYNAGIKKPRVNKPVMKNPL